MIAKGTLTGMGLFSLEILHVISMGKKELISEIEKHFEEGNVVEYLDEKYAEDFYVKFDNSTYDNQALNKYFSNYAGYIDGNERRKYGIMNDDDGLLLILALITDKLEIECQKWTVEE